MKETATTQKLDDILLMRAIVFAAEAHLGQVRKGGDIPFVVHPLEAAAIAATMTGDRHVIAAAVLHDVIEDTSVTAEEIRAAFGDDILSLVSGDTEDKRREQNPVDTWHIRKQETIDYVQSRATEREKIVILSDKLANLRSLARDFDTIGDRMWDKFHEKNPQSHAWYYRSVVKACTGLEGTAAHAECTRLLEHIFGNLTEKTDT